MFDWITGLISAMGLPGVALMMFLENLFPPIPSEIVMPLAGFNAARGESSLVGVILAGTLGSLLGALFWYEVARRVGADRLRRFAGSTGRWTAIAPGDIDAARRWFDRWGHLAVFLCRMVPTVRTLISIPAGLAEMPRAAFLAWSGVGTLAWTALLTLLGYWLESGYEAVSRWLDPATWIVVALVVAAYLWQVATYDRREARRAARDRRPD